MKTALYAISCVVLIAIFRHSFALGWWTTMGLVYLWAYAVSLFDGARGEG